MAETSEAVWSNFRETRDEHRWRPLVLLGDIEGLDDEQAQWFVACGIAWAYLGRGTDPATVEMAEDWGFSRP